MAVQVEVVATGLHMHSSFPPNVHGHQPRVLKIDVYNGDQRKLTFFGIPA